MNSDNMKAAWQAQSSQTRLTIDAKLLAQEVRRNERSFATVIAARDAREIGVAVVLTPIWIYLGVHWSLPWTWYFVIPGMLWVAGFMVLDRNRHNRKPPACDAPLREVVESSLAQVKHQTVLLRNIFWWYLLPLIIPMTAFHVHSIWNTLSSVWKTSGGDVGAVLTMAMCFVFTTVIIVGTFVWIYWLNQKAVCCSLEPRCQELEALLASLHDEPQKNSLSPRGTTE